MSLGISESMTLRTIKEGMDLKEEGFLDRQLLGEEERELPSSSVVCVCVCVCVCTHAHFWFIQDHFLL